MAATHTINTVPVSFILWNECARVEQVYKHTRDVTNTTQLQKWLRVCTCSFPATFTIITPNTIARRRPTPCVMLQVGTSE